MPNSKEDTNLSNGILRLLGVGSIGAIGAYAGYNALRGGVGEVQAMTKAVNNSARAALTETILQTANKSQVMQPSKIINKFLNTVVSPSGGLRFNPDVLGFFANVTESQFGYEPGKVKNFITAALNSPDTIDAANINMLQDFMKVLNPDVAYEHFVEAQRLPLDTLFLPKRLGVSNVGSIEALRTQLKGYDRVVEAMEELHDTMSISFAGKKHIQNFKPIFRVHRFDGTPYRIEAVYKGEGIRPIRMAFSLVNDNKVLISPEQGLAANARKVLFLPPEVRDRFFAGQINTLKDLYKHVMPYDVASVKTIAEIVRQTSENGLSPFEISKAISNALEQTSPGIVFGEEALTSPAYDAFGVRTDLEKIVQNQVFPFSPEYNPETGKVTVPLYKNATLHASQDFATDQQFYKILHQIEMENEDKIKMGVTHNISSQQIAKEIFADFGEGTYSRELLEPQLALAKPQQRIKPPFIDINPDFTPKVLTPELEDLVYKQGKVSRLFMNTYMGDPKITKFIMNKAGLPELYGELSAISADTASNLAIKDMAHVRVGLGKNTMIGEGLGEIFAKLVSGAQAMETGDTKALDQWEDVRNYIMKYSEKNDQPVREYFGKIMSNAEYRQKVFKFLQSQNPEFLSIRPGAGLALSTAGKTYAVGDYGQLKSLIAGMDVIPTKHGMNIEFILNNVYKPNVGAKFMGEFKTTVGQVMDSGTMRKIATLDAAIRATMRKHNKASLDIFGPAIDAYLKYDKVEDALGHLDEINAFPRGYRTIFRDFSRSIKRYSKLMETSSINIMGVEGRKKFMEQLVGAHNTADLENLIRLKKLVESEPKALGLSMAGKRHQKAVSAFSGFHDFFRDYLTPKQVTLPDGTTINAYDFNLNKHTDFKGLREKIDSFYEHLRKTSGLNSDIIDLFHSRDFGSFRMSYSFGLMPEMRGAGNPSSINHFVLQMLKSAGMEELAVEMVKNSDLNLTGWKGAIELIREATHPSKETALLNPDILSTDILYDIFQRTGADRVEYLRKLTDQPEASKFALDLGREIAHPETGEKIRYVPIATFKDHSMVGMYTTDEGERVVKTIDNAFHKVWIATQQAKDDELLGHAITGWFNTVSDAALSHGATDTLKMRLFHSAGLQGEGTPVTAGLIDEYTRVIKAANNSRLLRRWENLLKRHGLAKNPAETLQHTVQLATERFRDIAGKGVVTQGIVFRHPTFSPTSVMPATVMDSESFLRKAVAMREQALLGVNRLNAVQAQEVKQKVDTYINSVMGDMRRRNMVVGMPERLAALMKGDWDADLFNIFVPPTKEGRQKVMGFLQSFAQRDNEVTGRMSAFIDSLNEITSRKGLKMNVKSFQEKIGRENFGRFSPKDSLFYEMLSENIAAKKAVGRINLAVSSLRFGIANSGIADEDIARLNVLLSNLEENAITAGHGSAKALDQAIDIMESLDAHVSMPLSQRKAKVISTIKNIYNYDEIAKRADMAGTVQAIDETLGILDKNFHKIFANIGSTEHTIDEFAYRMKNRANPYQQLRKIIGTIKNENIAEDKLSGLGAAMASALQEAAGVESRGKVNRAVGTAERVIGAAIDEGVHGISSKWVLGGLAALGLAGFLMSPGDPDKKIEEARQAQELTQQAEGGTIPEGITPVHPPVAYVGQRKGGLSVAARASRRAGGNINAAVREIQSILGAKNVNIRFNRASEFASSRKADHLLKDAESYKWNQRGPYGN